MSSGMVPLELSKDNNQYCKISVFMPNAGSINESVISVTNVGGDSFSVAVSMIRWNANKVFCKLINGTKISNINMYYTVDTERFCFYIKANWYAKIIVSRLGLVNTSKIESINAIPSGAIEVPISWRDKRYSTDLGELLGNPKGTKSFSSWSEFTDFVNEMPIKTIQPFVSNFNAFAGEGFYGNVVQGLVIKQLEDAVFIFGIAIDGTLIFRKRNYPDVSTWEDPKIIIHSNNWHKIYFVTDLGGLIGINDTWIRRRFAIKDCNTAIAGVYNVDDTTTNNFPTGAYKFGTLLVANSGFFGSQYFVPDNFNADPYIYIRPISNNGNVFREWAKIKVTIIT